MTLADSVAGSLTCTTGTLGIRAPKRRLPRIWGIHGSSWGAAPYAVAFFWLGWVAGITPGSHLCSPARPCGHCTLRFVVSSLESGAGHEMDYRLIVRKLHS